MPKRQDSKSLTKARKAAAAKQKSNRAKVDNVANTAGVTEQLESPVEVDVPAIGRPD